MGRRTDATALLALGLTALIGCSAVVGGKVDDLPDSPAACITAADCPGVDGCNVRCDPGHARADAMGCISGEPTPDLTACGDAGRYCLSGRCQELGACDMDARCLCTESCNTDLGVCVPLDGGTRDSSEMMFEYCTEPPGLLGLCFLGMCRHACENNSSCRCSESCSGEAAGELLCMPGMRSRIEIRCWDEETAREGICNDMGDCIVAT